jgi:hypothetical protein
VLKWLVRLLKLAAGATLLLLVAVLVFIWRSRPIPLAFPPTAEAARHTPQAEGIANYNRPEEDTFYTYPEWYIVWSYQSKADYQRGHLPSGYPYFGDIAQYWQAYSLAYSATRGRYPFAAGDHIMLGVIGSSFSLEYALKGFYEKTIGRISQWTSHGEMVPEDTYAAQIAEDYAAFVHVRPFYEYSFWKALRGMLRSVPLRLNHPLRSIERRAWLTLDYTVESFYCELIQLATHATYGYEDTMTSAWLELPLDGGESVLAAVPHVQVKQDLGPEQKIVEIPRYQEFTPSAALLVNHGARFHQMAGNGLIAISAIAPSGWAASVPGTQLLLSQPIRSEPGHTRVLLLCRVTELHTVLPALERNAVRLEHLYDY